MNRLRDDVAKSGSDEKLIEAGLVYYLIGKFYHHKTTVKVCLIRGR